MMKDCNWTVLEFLVVGGRLSQEVNGQGGITLHFRTVGGGKTGRRREFEYLEAMVASAHGNLLP